MKTGKIYARYSSNNQTEQSIEGQIRVCREFAQRNGIIIVGTYIDRATTGTNDNREAFQRMLKDSDKKSFDYVLVYKLDRFSRNKYEMAIHRKHLKDNGVKILSAMENIPETPEGVLLESLLEGMNQYYSEELSQKTLRGLRETRIKGNFPGGRINFGYRVKNQKAVIYEEEAAIVREIFSRYANGARLIELVDELNERGILNKGKKFSTTVLYYMLENEKYIGLHTNRGVTYDNIFPAIVSKEVFDTVQKRILANKYGKHVPDIDYLLKGRVFCGYCGKPLHSATGTSSNGTIWRYYKCGSIKKRTGCQNESLKKELLEQIVLDTLTKALMEPSNFSVVVNGIMELHRQQLADDTQLRILEKELQHTAKAITNLLAAIEAGIFTDSTKSRLQELEEKKKELEEKILLEKSKVKASISREEIETYLKYAMQQSPKPLLDLLLQKVIVYKDRIKIYMKYVGDTLSDNSPDKNDTPDGTDSVRGLLILSYLIQIERKLPHGGRGKKRSYVTYTRNFSIELYL